MSNTMRLSNQQKRLKTYLLTHPNACVKVYANKYNPGICHIYDVCSSSRVRPVFKRRTIIAALEKKLLVLSSVDKRPICCDCEPIGSTDVDYFVVGIALGVLNRTDYVFIYKWNENIGV